MSSAPVATREFRIGDFAAASAVWAQAEGVDIAEGDAEEDLRSYLERNRELSRVALAGEKLVGAALCGHDGRRGYIYHLAVLPEYRGRGIAKLLVEECLAGLRRAKIKRALILVATDNQLGRAFWLRNGWELLDGAFAMARDV